MKKTFLILLVLLCVATMAVASASAASDDAVSDDADTSLTLNDNTVDSISSTDSDASISDSSQDIAASDSGTDDKSVGASPLNDGTTIYVSTTGDDSNDGSSEANAVATINHALQLATNGSTIRIGAGEYSSTTIESPAGKDINLIGADRDTTIIRIPDQTYGINVFESGISWKIENLTISDVSGTTTRSAAVQFAGDNSVLYMNNCIIKNIFTKCGAFSAQSDGGTATLNNTIIEDIYGTAGSSSVMYFNGEGTINLDNIEVRGFGLNESYAGATTTARTVFYAYGQYDIINLMNSRITGIAAPLYSGIIESKSKFNVVNTVIANNYINTSANGGNGGQFMFWSGTTSNSASAMNFTKCTIVNNTIAKDGYAIFNIAYGAHNIDHSIIMNNKYANGDDVPISMISSGTLTVDDNYWGTNARPNEKTRRWVILTADVPEMTFVGTTESIPIYLNTYNTTDGNTGAVEGMPDVTLDVTYLLNQDNPDTVTISNGQGAIDYYAQIDGDETISLSSGDSFSFEVNADVSTLIYVDAAAETSGNGTAESPFKTIAEALNIAADGKIIVVRSGTYTENDLVIDDDITIKAEKGANVVINSSEEGRAFVVTSTATIRDLNITGAMALDSTSIGGAILVNGGNLTLNNVKIFECTAGTGGAVGTTAGSYLTVINSKFIENSGMYGGAIYLASEANITGSTFNTNTVYGYGGAIYVNTTSPVTVSSNTFTDDSATKGTAMYIESGSPVLSENDMGDEIIYVAGGSLKTILTFIEGKTVNADFGEEITLTATLTSEDGNTVRGGSVVFTADGVTIATIDLTGIYQLSTNYTVPDTASGDIIISGSYSLDNAGTVVPGKIHPAVSYWFIEGGSGYETLAQAIDAAAAGDVIYYDLADDYTEKINGKTLNKAVTIKNNGTGAVTLDANRNKMFTVSANVELNNLKFINGADAVGGFISQSSSNLNVIGCTFKDVSSSNNGAAISTSYGNLNIDGCRFENISVKQGVLYFSATTGALNINNSVFDNILGSYDGWVISTSTVANIANSNFTNLVSSMASSGSYYGAVYSTKAMNVTNCLFKDIKGPKGAAIYSSGPLNVTRSVFDNIETAFSIIFASNADSFVNYNIFVNNANAAKYIESAIADSNYNFWGSNDKPNTTVVAANLYKNWTIIELSCASDIVYMGTTADIFAQFVGTDGTDNLTLEELMPDYTVDLTASSGTLNPTTVTIVENEGCVVFTPASQGEVTITCPQGPAELTLNIMDPAVLLVVSTDGSDSNPGTLDSPYATIAHALSQVTDTRNIIYLLNKGESYDENGLTVSGNVIIRGESDTVIIDGQNTGRIFTVTGTLTIEDLILTGGMSNDNGGAILVNGGNLTANNVVFSENGGANGGAIATTAGSNLSITDSVFSENIAMYGGAIYTEGEAAISGSQFSEHEFTTYGGAIYVNTTSPVAISSNTFDNNDADKGEAIYIENGAVSLSENTIEDEESIYLAGGTANTVLTFLGNATVNANFGEEVTLTATLTDDKGNTIVGGNVVFTANGETVATVANTGSAIQATYTVPSDASSDILISGSYSFDNGGTVATGVVHPAINYWFIEGGSGYETLTQAIDAAQAGDVIYGIPGTYDISGVTVNKAVTIKANESGSIILNGNGNQILKTSANVILENLTFINGTATQNGGLIYIASNSLVINNSVFKDTQATGGQGAAIYVASGASNVVIENSAFDNINTTGAAIINCRSSSSVFTVSKSNFTNMNISTNGVFYFYEGGINAIESQFINITGGDGAAIYFYGINNNNVTKCLFENVTTTKTSGIIYSNGKSANVSYNVFLGINKGMHSSSSYSGYITADYNYWGTNDNPSEYVNSNTKLNNWVIMTVTPDTLESVEPGATQAFVVDFTHCTDGTANYTLADTIPELTVSASALKGDLDQAAIETVNGIATFTYTASATGEETVTFTNANVAIPVSFVVGDGYFGIIYVSKDGSDGNRGDEENPVASIAKAVELAQGKSGKIIVNEGTYVVKGVNITDDLEISTVGDVIFDGDGTRALYVQAGDVSIYNTTFKNCLEQYSGSAIRVSGGDLTIDGCTFVDNGGENARDSIINVKNAALTVKNSLFENNTAHATSTSYSVIYASGATLIVDNTQFIDNKLKYGAIYATGTIAVINNTLFQGFSSVSSSGGSGCGIYLGGTSAYQYSNGTVRPGEPSIVLVENCAFINNTANGGSLYAGQGAAIYVNNNASLVVKDSLFANNTAASNTNGTITGKGGAIYASAGDVSVINSVFENNQAGEGSEIYMRAYGPDVTTLNKLNVSNCIIIDNGDSVIVSNYTNGTLLANSNWWGNNSGAEGKVSEGITVDNWVIMNVEPTLVENAITGKPVEINVDFKHTNSTDGTVANLEGTLPQEFTVYAGIASGTISDSPVETEDLVAKFIYTPALAGETIVNIYTDVDNTVPVMVYATEPYTGPIYVSKDGSDENDGQENTPVATIAKAIELATAEGASGQVIINEGTYTESGIVINDDVAINAVGDVILNGNGARYFDIKAGEVSIANVTMTNCNNTYGGAVIRVTGGSLTIEDSNIVANGGEYRDNLIRVTTASLTLRNVLFENNTAHKTSTNYGGVYVSDGVLIADNCTFVNNFNKYGQFYITGSSIGSYAVINNTKFIGNNATSTSGGSGAGIYVSGTAAYQYSNGTVRPGAPSTVYVVDCDFIANRAGGGTYYAGQGGAIYVNNNATLMVSDSRFINNTLDDNTNGTISSQGGAIFSSAGNVFITNSVFENNQASEGSEIYMKAYGPDIINLNKLNITNSIIRDDGDSVIVSNYTNGSLVANNNFWGNNSGAGDKVSEGITVDNWVIMNVNPTSVTLTEASPVEITVDFNHVTDAQGNIAELEGTLPEEFTITAMTMDGSISPASVTTVDGVAKVIFTPAESGESIAYIIYDYAIFVPVNVTVSEPYSGPIYVAVDGNDENPGSPEAPVASIAKAVELANAGSGQVIIREGTYYESNITLDGEKSIAITGEGNVVIDAGESTDSTFYMHGGEATFANITFTGGKPNYGGAIRVNAARGGTSRNVIDINLTVENCTFKDSKTTSRGGAIYAWYTKGNMIIKDSEFSGMKTTGWGGAVCVGYSAYEGALNFEVINSSFHDNSANNGGALYIYADTINIADSTFYNNNATYSPGAIYLYNTTATMDNCTIYDNHGKNTAAAIEIEAVAGQPIATLTITNSVIENNTGLDALAPAINVDKATLFVSYSSLVNDLSLNTVTATGYDAVYGQGIAIANNNWWGTNDPTTAVNGTNITIDKWVIMNVEANATDVVAGDEVKITVDFNHVNTTAGEIEELTGGVIPKDAYTVVFTAENGTVAPQTVEVPKGESADVIFTAAQPFATVTATCEEAVATLIFEGEIPEPYTGIVYVSKDGDDANNGSEDAPVASIEKAVEIATGEFGSGEIIVNEGTYTGYNFLVTKDLTITGVGDVTIDGEGLGRLFNMTYGTVMDKFTLNNLVLTGAKSNFGAIVYSYAKETVLNNVTIINNPGAGDLITTYGDLSIVNSTISNNDVGDIIQSSSAATIIINGTIINNNTVTADSQNYGIVYISGSNSNLIVENSLFLDNVARQGVLIGSTGTNITVKDTAFINNNNTVAYGGVIRALDKLDVSDSIFVSNNAGREGGAIYIGSSGDANIVKSAFINNTCANYDSDYNGDAISNNGKLTINYCILLPAEGSSKVLIFNRNEDETPNAQYNWWGTNDDPSYLVAGDSYYDSWDGDVNCPAPDVSNWIIMNVEYDIDDIEAGAALPITVDFKHYIDADGVVQELADSLAQELDVIFSSESGSFDKEYAITENQVATAIYTVAEGLNNITVKSSNASVNIVFETSTPIETNVTIGAGNIWIGNPEEVVIVVQAADDSDVEGTVTIRINGFEETIDLFLGIAGYVIPADKLVAGENTVSVAYNGLGQYLPSEANASFMVLDGVVTKDTFKYYFDEENNYTLFDYVPEGATLDFQGDFIGAFTTNIDKPVNIVSTTGDAFIETNKTGSFNILYGGSGTNVTGLSFLNTAFYITNASDVVIDDISMIANMSGVGSSTGFLSIRSNSSYVTVKNSYFENGGTGSSCVVIGMSSHCVIDNNVINATNNSGNLIYITTYVGTGDTPCYNNITNNVIESQVNSGFCYAIAVIGGYNLIENNTINHPGAGIVQQSTWGAAPQPNGFNSYINNTLTGGCGLTAMVNSTVKDNNVAGAMTLNGDCTAEGNTANSLTISGANCIVRDNTINGAVTVAAAAKGTEITENTISGLVTVNSNDNIISGNDIRTSSEYTVDLKATSNNLVTDNTLYAVEKVGDASVNFAEDKNNTVKENYPLSTELTLVVDDAVTGEASNINVKLVDSKGQGVTGTVKITVGDSVYNVEITYGKGSVAIGPFEETGTYDISASFEDEDYAPATAEASLTVYGPGNVTVKHTDAGDAHDIQAAIDAANPGDVVQLGDYDYTDVADVNITKPVTLAGNEGTSITSTGDGTPIFNVPAISEDGPESVNITGIDFKLNNGDTVVKATADNDTENPLSIVTPSISITGNNFETANEDVVPESINILELDSERGVLSPTGEIGISGNTIAAGISPFEFEVTSAVSEGDVNVGPQNFTPERKATVIEYSDMNTTAVSPLDPRTGEWFVWRLVDGDGNPIANTPMKIGFNGVIYDEKNGMVTDENGYAKLQINLGYKGDYTFAISFLGDDKYNASFVVAKIKVATQTGSLTVPSKSYAASAKTKSLTATFKTKSGKVVANKKISFTVNGKTYSAKTNDKGVATVNVSLNKKGTYSFTAKFAGDSTYTEMSKTAKLTIK